MSLKEWILVKTIGYKATSSSYVNHLKAIGVSVGEDVKLARPMNTTIDVQNPHLLSIGDHVMITGPATILTHDYSWCIIKRKYGDILGNQRETRIGSNVFIGWGATILGGSTIEDNTIIGANSVVSGHFRGDSVYAGNPARFLMSLDDYYKRRASKQLEEAVSYAIKYKKCYGYYPPVDKLDEYFFLFTAGDNEELLRIFNSRMKLMGNYEQTFMRLKSRGPGFNSYQQFLEYCRYQEINN